MLHKNKTLKQLVDKYGIESKEVQQLLMKNIDHCPACGLKIKQDKNDKYTYFFPCSCFDKNFRISKV